MSDPHKGTTLAGPLTRPIDSAGADKSRAKMPHEVEPDHYSVKDDFEYLDSGKWSTVKDAAASAAASTDHDSGQLIITTGGNDDEGGTVQLAAESFRLTSDKALVLEAKYNVSAAADHDSFVGLSLKAVTNPEEILTATDRVGFQIDDGDASILCKTEKDGTETSTDSGVDLSDSTDVKVAIVADGSGSVKFYINDSLVATHTTNVPDDENLAPVMFILAGSASSMTLNADYIVASQER